MDGPRQSGTDEDATGTGGPYSGTPATPVLSDPPEGPGAGGGETTQGSILGRGGQASHQLHGVPSQPRVAARAWGESRQGEMRRDRERSAIPRLVPRTALVGPARD